MRRIVSAPMQVKTPTGNNKKFRQTNIEEMQKFLQGMKNKLVISLFISTI